MPDPSLLDLSLATLAIAAVMAVIWLTARWLHRLILQACSRAHPHGRRLAERASRSGPWQSFHRHFPRPAEFLAARLHPRRFTGLPFSLCLAALVYIALLLGGLTEEVLESEEIRALDAGVMRLVALLRSEATLQLFLWLTRFGDTETLIAVTLVITAMLGVHGPRAYLLPVWISVLGAQATSWAGKLVFDRARPEFILDVTYVSPAFPSGHATGAVSVYVLLAYILARDLKRPRARFEIFFWLSALAGLIGLSRLVIGVHHPSDVAAGFLIGLFWVIVAVTVAELLKTAKKP